MPEFIATGFQIIVMYCVFNKDSAIKVSKKTESKVKSKASIAESSPSSPTSSSKILTTTSEHKSILTNSSLSKASSSESSDSNLHLSESGSSIESNTRISLKMSDDGWKKYWKSVSANTGTKNLMKVEGLKTKNYRSY